MFSLTSGLENDSDKFKIIITLRQGHKFGDTGPYKNFYFLFNPLRLSVFRKFKLNAMGQICPLSLRGLNHVGSGTSDLWIQSNSNYAFINKTIIWASRFQNDIFQDSISSKLPIKYFVFVQMTHGTWFIDPCFMAHDSHDPCHAVTMVPHYHLPEASWSLNETKSCNSIMWVLCNWDCHRVAIDKM